MAEGREKERVRKGDTSTARTCHFVTYWSAMRFVRVCGPRVTVIARPQPTGITVRRWRPYGRADDLTGTGESRWLTSASRTNQIANNDETTHVHHSEHSPSPLESRQPPKGSLQPAAAIRPRTKWCARGKRMCRKSSTWKLVF